MSFVEFSAVEKKYGKNLALQGFNLKVSEGELVTLLGPSGCGKTTALRILAGLIQQSSGQVFIDGEEISTLPTTKRNIGMVFQSYSLFPNLTARSNMEFGLRARKAPAEVIRSRVEALLEVSGLSEHQAKYPHQLSGGQQQRVSLVRALVTQPRVLLLDEPLSALDAQVRVQIREEVRRLQRELGITTIFVTHDQEEAMSISDRVGVMRDGVLLQVDTPQALYDNPSHPFVARFFGTVNEILSESGTSNTVLLWGREHSFVSDSGSSNEQRIALIRPESIRMSQDTTGIRASVKSLSFLGPISTLDIVPNLPSVPGAPKGQSLRVVTSSHQVSEIRPGDTVHFEIEANKIFLTDSRN